jgi:hypothetical protein
MPLESDSSRWDKQTLAAVAAIAALFCAFFWFGFFVGKKTAGHAATPSAVAQPREEAPVTERLVWRIGSPDRVASPVRQ